MAFSKLNSVEYHVIHQLSGVNLNRSEVAEPATGYSGQCRYTPSAQLKRSVDEVLMESELKQELD